MLLLFPLLKQLLTWGSRGAGLGCQGAKLSAISATPTLRHAGQPPRLLIAAHNFSSYRVSVCRVF
jgi:hypothetical protein